MGGNESSTQDAKPSDSKGGQRVLLNVYQPAGAANVPGFGVYHSGVVLFDTEYTFAGGESTLTGVYSHRPRQQPPDGPDGSRWQFKETVDLGACEYTKAEVKEMVSELQKGFKANSYHLTSRNCNHFAEAFCQMLGVTFPSWVNRLANVGDNFKGLMGAAGAQGQPTAKPPPEVATKVEETVNVMTCVDVASAGCLNESSNYPLATFLAHKSYLESDADAQLLLFLPFRSPVKLMGVVIKVMPGEGVAKCPKKIRLWKNKPNMDFQDTDNACTEEFEITAADLATPVVSGLISIVKPLTFVKFLDVSFLTIFVESNCGNRDTTRIQGLELPGQARAQAGFKAVAKPVGGKAA